MAVAGISLISALVVPILMPFCPQSPVYLAMKYSTNGSEQILDSLRRLRHKSSRIEDEFEALARQGHGHELAANTGSFETFLLPSFWKPMILALVMMVFQQMNGINVVVFYQLQIFEQAGSKLNAHLCSIITGAVLVVSTMVASLLVDRFGRKSLLVASGLGMAGSLALLGFYFEKIDNDTSHHFMDTYGWMSLVSLMAFLAFYSVGFGPVTFMLVPEMTPMAGENAITMCVSC